MFLSRGDRDLGLDLVKVYKQTAEQIADLRKTYDIPKEG